MPLWTFVRHGQSEANRARRFAGHLDPALTDEGRAQARRARALLREVPHRRVLVSDLARARQTARILLGDGAEVTVRRALRERHCGVYEGRPYAEAEACGDMDRVFRRFRGRPEGGESLEDVARRALAELLRWRDEGDLLVVCHGALIRAVVGVLDGLEDDWIGTYKPRNLEFVVRRVDHGMLARAAERLAVGRG
ncbi:MAG: histidine phosphatase family protein [Deltaproteobacteria bacterium]|nr:MAG: histidine phosphatase family protein [Deltaproteobacteria bacterium]